MKITTSFLPCFIILLCVLALTSLASEVSQASRRRAIHILKGAGRGDKFNLDTYGNEFELNTKHFIAHVGKGQKGRGSNGGSNNFPRGRPYKSSALSLKQPFIFTSTIGVIFGLSPLLALLYVIQ